ncbi:PAS domain-containing sensor histidine kinase [Methanolobus halotolerans]|nr:PAS domain-containing sensor histidine kinase [Methanolobus halotolerans]
MLHASSPANRILEKAVDEIPVLFCAYGKVSSRIVWKTQTFRSSCFEGKGKKIAHDIVVGGQKTGIIEIYFNNVQTDIEKWDMQSFPSRDSSVLLDRISQFIGKFLAKEQMLEHLNVSEKNIRNIFDNLHDHIFVLDQEGNILDCNRASMNCLNFGCSQISQFKLADTGYIGSKEVDTIIEHTLNHGAFNQETECLCTDGRITATIDSCCVDYNEEEAILLVVRDISKTKEHEDRVKTYTEELKSSGELKELFIDIIRHDLLTPAGIIKGFTEELICEPCSEEKDPALRKIYENINRLIELLESATKLSKLQKVEQVQFEKIDLVPVFQIAGENLKTEADSKRQQIVIRRDLSCPAKVNPIIGEVFLNLLSNAIKYSPEDSNINVDFLDENDHWKITVKDCGHGISDIDKARIFDRFMRADKKGIKGSGLGLAIVKRIIELHDGNYGVEDNLDGQGSVFWVTVRKA